MNFPLFFAAVSGGFVAVIAIIALALGGLIVWIAQNVRSKSLLKSTQQQVENLLDEARQKSENILKTAQLEAKAEATSTGFCGYLCRCYK